jgi:hypothetical protein
MWVPCKMHVGIYLDHPIRVANVRQEYHSCRQFKMDNRYYFSKRPLQLQDLCVLISLTSDHSHGMLHPVGFRFFYITIVSLLDRFSTTFPIKSARCCDRDSASHISLVTRERSVFLLRTLSSRRCPAIMRTTLILLGALASLGLAAPTQTTSYQRSPELVDFYSVVDNHIHQAKARGLTQQPPTCDLTHAAMPVAPVPLPSPGPGLILREVTIGRGVQVRLPPS